MKLYKIDMSPPARAAMMVAEILDVKIELIEVDLFIGEHLKPEFVKKNPLHTIPMLEDGDLILHDSHVILTYLVDTYGKNDTLYPKQLKQRALVDQKLYFDTAILFPRLRNVTYAAAFEGLKKPTEKHLNDIDEAYSFLETFLSKTKWLAAECMTIADIAAVATVTSLVHILPLDAKKYPKTASWLSIMEKQSFCKSKNEKGAAGIGEFVRQKLQLTH